MLKNKILVKITGSIAAYKSAYLISKLIQSKFEVKVVVTKSSLQFIGIATLEGLTHMPVFSDTFAQGKMMSHIDLTKWADLTIVVPADANTINKFASGIADNLVTSLFMAQDFSKPYLIAPAMNTNMYNHPATQKSLKILAEWGSKILPTDDGHLACGDEGLGKLLDTNKIFDTIIRELAKENPKHKKVLITGGGTLEYIDGVRYITNLSTGKTAGNIADYLFEAGNDVTLLKSETTINPMHAISTENFNSFKSLKSKLKKLVESKEYDAVIHLAAVSDYSPTKIRVNGNEEKLFETEKLSSKQEEIEIVLTKNEKIINNIKQWSKKIKLQLFAFKFTASGNAEENHDAIEKLFASADADFVIHNSLKNRKENVQTEYEIIEQKGNKQKVSTSLDLAKELNKIIAEKRDDTLS